MLRGEPGVGKTALLDYLTEHAEGCRIARAVGVESEMELAYSGLHQLCRPMLDVVERLPPAQREALATVFGVGESLPPDRFLVGLATLSLFAELAEEQPLVCVIDDAQWLDEASAQILGFVARRLLAERVALVGAVRTGIGDNILSGVPELRVDPLGEADARALLLENLIGPLDAAVCDEIVAESHGNPLALLEFPRTWGAAELAGGFALPVGRPVAETIEVEFSRRLDRLPRDTRLLVLSAAAEPLGDPILLHSAAKILEIDMTAVDPAVDAGLLTVGQRVEFAHPLVRSSAYRSAATRDRHRVHRALADATDTETDPDRRAWHLARATPGPNEEVALELERSAGRAQARGGMAAAAAFLQRAVELTPDPARRAGRALAAAEAAYLAGAFDKVERLLTTAEAYPLDGFQRARAALLRGQVAVVLGYGKDAPQLLLEAARRARTDRPGARSGCLPDRVWFGVRCRASRATGRLPRDLPCRREPRFEGQPAGPVGPLTRRAGPIAHGRSRGRDPDPAARDERRGRAFGRGRRALGLARPGGQQGRVGLRCLHRHLPAPGPDRPRRWCARGVTATPLCARD